MDYTMIKDCKKMRVGNVEYGKIFQCADWCYLKINDSSVSGLNPNKCFGVLLATGFVERFDPDQVVEVKEQVNLLELR